MELILWRHAEAEDPGPGGDFVRELTKKGRRQAERMAAWLKPRLEGDWQLLVSPAARAMQTAAALDLQPDVRPALDPSARADTILREAGWPTAGRVIVVGHQPTLGEVASILMGGPRGDVAIRKGAIWWFATRDGVTTLRAVLAPDLVEKD
jgi:phosphohistidine phosphatase